MPLKPTPEPSPIGRIMVFALARAEGCTHSEAVHIVEQMVKPGEGPPSLEDILVAVEDEIQSREPPDF